MGKPRIKFEDGQWSCWTWAIWGARTVGFGDTPGQAYARWLEARHA